jgi:hypothetical protein
MWWWRRKHEISDGEAVLAVAHAERASEKAESRRSEVSWMSSRLRVENSVNRFGEHAKAGMRRRPA